MDMTLIIDSNLHHFVFRTHQVCVASANEHSAASIQECVASAPEHSTAQYQVRVASVSEHSIVA